MKRFNSILVFILVVCFVYIIAGCSGSGSDGTENSLNNEAGTISSTYGSIKGQARVESGTKDNILIILESTAGNSKSLTTTTDKDGNYSFSEVPSGNYKMLAAKGASLRAEKKNIVVGEGTTTVVIELTPSGSISGSIVAGTGLPINITDLSKALVFIEGTSNIAVTDTAGSFVLSNIPVGTYSLSVMTSTIPPLTGKIENITVVSGTVTPSGVITLDSAISSSSQTGVISGTIKNSEGSPIEAMAFITGNPFMTISDNQGNFSMPNIPVGTHKLIIKPMNDNDNGDKEVDVTVAVNQTTTLNIVLDKLPSRPYVMNLQNYTRSTPVTFSGSKDAGTSIYINNVLKVAENASKEWSISYDLQPGFNKLKITSKNTNGLESDYESRVIYYEINNNLTPPTVSSSLTTDTDHIMLYGSKAEDSNVEILSSNGTTIVSRYEGYGASWQTEIGGLISGNNNFYIRSSDHYGATSTSSPLLITRSAATATSAAGVVVNSLTHNNITSNSADINISLSAPGFVMVKYGTSSSNLNMESSMSTTPSASHTINLNGLSPTTTYYYEAVAYDFQYNESTSNTGNFITDTIPVGPDLVSIEIDNSNRYIDVNFNQGVWGSAANTIPVASGSFNFNFIQNSDSATSVEMIGATVNNGDSFASSSTLTGGESTIRLWMSMSGASNGLGDFEISPQPSSIFNSSGIDASDSDTESGNFNNMITGPAFVFASIAPDNSYVDVGFNQHVYGDPAHSSALTDNAFNTNYEQNGDSVGFIWANSVRHADGLASTSATSLNGGEDLVRVFVFRDSTPPSTGKGRFALWPNGSMIYNYWGVAAVADYSDSIEFSALSQRDPSFESYSGSTDGYWTELGTVTSVESSSSFARHGSKSCVFVDPTTLYTDRGIEMTNPYAPISDAYTYKIVVLAHIENEAGSSNIADTQIKVTASWFNGGSAGAGSPVDSGGVTLSNFSKWEKVEILTASPGTGDDGIKIKIEVKETVDNNNDVYIDSVYLFQN